MLQITDLCFDYPERQLFAGLCVTVTPGVNLVRGGDGRGKTTLLRLMAGELLPASGTLHFTGPALHAPAAHDPKNIFWTDPRSEAFDQLTIDEFFNLQRETFPGFDGAVANALVDSLDLAVHRHKKLFMLSTGSKRKVWLAAAFASGAALTLLDMPFAAVDKSSCVVITGLLREAEGSSRALVVADYEAPEGVRLAGLVDLGD